MFSRKQLALLFIGAITISFLLYGNTFKNEFVWDDAFYTIREELSDSRHLLKLWFEPVLPDTTANGLYRPLTVFSYSLNLIIGGKNPFGFHLVSVILNGIASFLVLLLISRLFKNKSLAIFGALFFAFLPIHTEAAAFMKARDDILSAIFAILSWLIFFRATTGGDRLRFGWLLGSAFLFFLGLLSKEFVVIAPVLFLLVYRIQNPTLLRKRFLRNALLSMFCYGILFFIYLGMRYIALPQMSFGNDDISPISNVLIMPAPWMRILTAFKVVYIYISKLFVPINLSASYHFKAVTLVGNLLYSWRGMLGLLFLGILLGLVLWKRTRARPLGIGALTFLILYFPISQFLFVGGDIVGERWMYFPSLGMAIITGWLFSSILERKKIIALILFISVLGFYTSIIIPRNRIWKDSLSLFSSMIKDAPKSVKGYSNLAQYYLEHENIVKAQELVERGFAISNQEPNLYVVAGAIAYQRGDYEKAESLLIEALSRDTFSTPALLNLPRVYFAEQKYEEAFSVFEDFISKLPSSTVKFQDRLLYATILAKLGRYEESLVYIQTDLASNLDQVDVRKLIAGDYYRLGKKEEALKYFDLEPGETYEDAVKILEKFP